MTKKRSWLWVLSLVLMGSVNAQQDSAFIAPLAEKSLLLDITVVNGNGLVAVGERGHVLRSSDGNDWQQQQVPTEVTLTAVDFVGQIGWAVGHDSLIMKTEDGGQSWQIQQFLPEDERPLLDVAFFDADWGIAVGAYGTYYLTRDGGQNWESIRHAALLSEDDRLYLEDIRAEDEDFYQQELASILPHLNRIRKVGERLYMAGEAGLLAVSEDRGETWLRMDVDYIGSFFDIAETTSGRLLAAGLRGNLFAFDSELGEWQPIRNQSKASFNALLILDDEQTLALGNNGVVLQIGPQDTQYHQLEDGKALVSAVKFQQQILAVSEVGIKKLSLEKFSH